MLKLIYFISTDIQKGTVLGYGHGYAQNEFEVGVNPSNTEHFLDYESFAEKLGAYAEMFPELEIVVPEAAPLTPEQNENIA